MDYEILKSIADVKEVHPSPDTLKIAQNRILEKKFANELGIKTTEWKIIKSLDELKDGIKFLGKPLPNILALTPTTEPVLNIVFIPHFE